jgi:hypothetical protein
MKRSLVQPVPTLAILLLAACAAAAGQSAQKPKPHPTADPAEKQVQAILAEAKRIDTANDAPEAAGRRQLTKELPNWEFSGVLEGPTPVFLSARFTEGQVVREESYYLLHGELILARVEKYWDVEETQKSPEPATLQDFYINHDQTIRHVTRVKSSPPITRIDKATRPSGTLIERSRLIAQILLSTAPAKTASDSLNKFPEAEPAEN